jgi:hypothetical protein
LANPVLSQPDMERKWLLLRPARVFPHSRFTTYCRTFLQKNAHRQPKKIDLRSVLAASETSRKRERSVCFRKKSLGQPLVRYEYFSGNGNENHFRFRFRFRWNWTLAVRESRRELKKLSSDAWKLAIPTEIKILNKRNSAFYALITWISFYVLVSRRLSIRCLNSSPITHHTSHLTKNNLKGLHWHEQQNNSLPFHAFHQDT